jgi:hypothetical protein
MPLQYRGGGHTCCCGNCPPFFSDSLGGSSIGANWSVVSGAWAESGGYLHTASADAEIACQQKITTSNCPTGNVYGSATVSIVANNTIETQLLCEVCGVQISFDNGTVEIDLLDSDGETLLTEYVTDTNSAVAVTLCLSSGEDGDGDALVCATVTLDGQTVIPSYQLDGTGTPAGASWSLGTSEDSVGTAQFSGVAIYPTQECNSACSPCTGCTLFAADLTYNALCEVRITWSNYGSGGFWTFNYRGASSGHIDSAANAAAVQSAIQAMSGLSDATVSLVPTAGTTELLVVLEGVATPASAASVTNSTSTGTVTVTNNTGQFNSPTDGWIIEDGELQATEADAQISLPNPSCNIGEGLNGGYQISADVSSSEDGDQVQIGLPGDTLVQLEFGSGTLTLMGNVDATQCTVSAPTGQFQTLAVCISPPTNLAGGSGIGTSGLVVLFNGTPMLTCFANGNFVPGLSTADLTGVASFKNIAITAGAACIATCPTCVVCCWPLPSTIGGTVPNSITADLSGFEDGGGNAWSQLNGTYSFNNIGPCTPPTPLAATSPYLGLQACGCWTISSMSVVISDTVTIIRATLWVGIGNDAGADCEIVIEFQTTDGSVVAEAYQYLQGAGGSPATIGCPGAVLALTNFAGSYGSPEVNLST